MKISEKKSLLIIDSDEPTRNIFKTLLDALPVKCSIFDFDDLAKALQIARLQKFDLLISGYKVQVDFAGVLRKFNQLNPQLRPAAALLYASESFNYSWPFGGGPLYYLKKPAPQEEIQKTLESILLNPFEAESKQLIEGFMGIFEQVTQQVFSITTSIAVKKQSSFFIKKAHRSGDISAVLPLTGEKIQGVLGVAFDAQSFLEVAEKMLGEKVLEVTQENSQVAGEICNQIVGLARKPLFDLGHLIQPALPQIVVQKGHSISHLPDAFVAATRFTTEKGSFTLELSLRKS